MQKNGGTEDENRACVLRRLRAQQTETAREKGLQKTAPKNGNQLRGFSWHRPEIDQSINRYQKAVIVLARGLRAAFRGPGPC